MTLAHCIQRASNFAMRKGLLMMALGSEPGQRRSDHFSGRVVFTVPLRYRPFHDSSNALPDPLHSLAFGIPVWG